MLHVVLRTGIGTGDLPMGPTDSLQMVGPSLQNAQGKVVAVHSRGMWTVGERAFATVSLGEYFVTLEFRNDNFDATETFPNVERVQIIDGAVWGGRSPTLIAQFDEVLDAWHLHSRPAVAMPVLIIRPGKGPSQAAE